MPFVDKKALAQLYRRLENHKFNYIIQLGDLFDAHCFSSFTKHPSVDSKEIHKAKDMADNMWEKINRLQKKAKKIQLLGNHDARLLKRVREKLPEAESLVRETIGNLFTFEKVKTIHDPREEFYIGDIAFIHGYRSKLGDHAKFMQSSVVHGHSHRPGVTFLPLKDKTIFELDCGYLADKNSPALAYTPQKFSNWTSGWGEINDGVPRFICTQK